MIDERDVFERSFRRHEPEGGSFERLEHRRDRRRQGRRITGGVVGIAVFVAAIWIVITGGPFDRSERSQLPGGSGTTGPAETGPGPNGPYTAPTYTMGPVTPEDIALGESFLQAWANGDGEAAAALFSPEGNFDGFEPAILPALHDWFRAEGWTFRAAGCGLHGWGDRRGVVGCQYAYENDLTRALGLPPVQTAVSFVTDAHGIATAWYGEAGDAQYDMFSGYRGGDSLGSQFAPAVLEDVLGPVWDTLLDRIASNHPEDLVRMYDADHDYPILDPASIELWRRYTREFLASPEAQALARSIHDAGWDGAGIPPAGTATSTPVEGELIADFAEFHFGFVFVYADGRVISQRAMARGGSGRTTERLLTPEGVELVRSGAVEAADFLTSSSPVPADAWVQAEGRHYAPARYAVCFWQDDANPDINGGYEYPSTVLRFLPAGAREILTDRELTTGTSHPVSGDGKHVVECSGVTTDEARDLYDILYGLGLEDAEGDGIVVEVPELLPHGEWVPHVDG